MNQSGLHGRSAKGFVEVAHLGMFFFQIHVFFSKSLFFSMVSLLNFGQQLGQRFWLLDSHDA